MNRNASVPPLCNAGALMATLGAAPALGSP